MSYARNAQRKKEWKNLEPEIYRAMREGLSVEQFWDAKGWKSREDWYRIKPKGFNWKSIQRELLTTGEIPKYEIPEDEIKSDNRELKKGLWFNLGELQNKQYKDLNRDELKSYKKIYMEERKKILKKYQCKTLIELRNKYNVSGVKELLEKKIMPLHVVYQKEQEANKKIEQKEIPKLIQPQLINDTPPEVIQNKVKISFEGQPSAIKSMLKTLLGN